MTNRLETPKDSRVSMNDATNLLRCKSSMKHRVTTSTIDPSRLAKCVAFLGWKEARCMRRDTTVMNRIGEDASATENLIKKGQRDEINCLSFGFDAHSSFIP